MGDKGGDKANVKLCSSELEPARRVAVEAGWREVRGGGRDQGSVGLLFAGG